MEGKAIVFTRVSTLSQNSLDEQEKAVYQMALNDGYTKDNIICISYKESGRKLTEEERLGINELKEKIATENITTIYCFSISRLARTKKVLFSVEDLLLQNKIQLVIKEPSLVKLLNPDGSVNEAMEMIFTLYAQMAESEMRVKFARFKIGKSKAKSENKFLGGTQKYGYTVDSNGYYKIDEDNTAPIVRLIYKLYLTDEFGSSWKVCKELKERGYNVKRSTVELVLRDPIYCGINTTKEPIITKELFNKVQQKRLTNDTSADKSVKYFFGSHLLRCLECGGGFTTYNSRAYTCYHHSTKNKAPEACECKDCISINIFDSCAWNVAITLEILRLSNKSEDRKKELEEKISVLSQKISNISFDQINEKVERITDSYIDGIITKEKRDERLKSIERERKELENKQTLWKEQLTFLEEELNSFNNTDLTVGEMMELIDKSAKSNDYKEMYQIVHRNLSFATIGEESVDGYRSKLIKFYNKADELITSFNFLYKKRELRDSSGNIIWTHKGGSVGDFVYLMRGKVGD